MSDSNPPSEQSLTTGESAQTDQTVMLKITFDEFPVDESLLNGREFSVTGAMIFSHTDSTPRDLSAESQSQRNAQQAYDLNNQDAVDSINNSKTVLKEASDLLLKCAENIGKLEGELAIGRSSDVERKMHSQLKITACEVIKMLENLTGCDLTGATQEISGPRDSPSNAPHDAPQSAPQDAPQSAPQDAPQSVPQDAPQSAPQDAPKSAPQDAPQSAPQDAPRVVLSIASTREISVDEESNVQSDADANLGEGTGQPAEDSEHEEGPVRQLSAKQIKRKDLKKRKKQEKKLKREEEEAKEKERKAEDQKAKNQRKYRKYYWNLILTTFFTTMNDIDSKKVDKEKVDFHEMMENIHGFDKGADWAKYERWNVQTLINKLLGPVKTWEGLNDTQHLLCRALKSLHDQGTHTECVKKVLAYFHHCSSQHPGQTRFLYRLSNEFESDVWDWIVCNYQNSLEKYVIAQEEIRGEVASKPDYDTLPLFMDRLKYYETRKNKDVENAFLYECYDFFKNHVHIESEVLNADFQEILAHPKESQRNAELKYFRKVLGLDDNMMIVF